MVKVLYFMGPALMCILALTIQAQAVPSPHVSKDGPGNEQVLIQDSTHSESATRELAPPKHEVLVG